MRHLCEKVCTRVAVLKVGIDPLGLIMCLWNELRQNIGMRFLINQFVARGSREDCVGRVESAQDYEAKLRSQFFENSGFHCVGHRQVRHCQHCWTKVLDEYSFRKTHSATYECAINFLRKMERSAKYLRLHLKERRQRIWQKKDWWSHFQGSPTLVQHPSDSKRRLSQSFRLMTFDTNECVSWPQDLWCILALRRSTGKTSNTQFHVVTQYSLKILSVNKPPAYTEEKRHYNRLSSYILLWTSLVHQLPRHGTLHATFFGENVKQGGRPRSPVGFLLWNQKVHWNKN